MGPRPALGLTYLRRVGWVEVLQVQLEVAQHAPVDHMGE